MKLNTGIVFAAMATTGLLLPRSVDCTMEYDTLRLRQLVDGLMERYPFLRDMEDEESTSNNVVSARSAPPPAQLIEDAPNSANGPAAQTLEQYVKVQAIMICPPESRMPPDHHIQEPCSLPSSIKLKSVPNTCPGFLKLSKTCYGDGSKQTERNPSKIQRLYFIANPPYNEVKECGWKKTVEECGIQDEAQVYVVDTPRKTETDKARMQVYQSYSWLKAQKQDT